MSTPTLTTTAAATPTDGADNDAAANRGASPRSAPLRVWYFSHPLLESKAVGDSRAAVDELLDLLADPETDPQVRAAINEWLNG